MEIEFDEMPKVKGKKSRKIKGNKFKIVKVIFFSLLVAIILLIFITFLKSFLIPSSLSADSFEITLDLTKLEVKENASSEVVHLFIRQRQDIKEPVSLEVRFVNENKDYVKVFDATTGQELTSFSTFTFNKKGLIFVKNFVVQGKKVVGQQYSPWKITVVVSAMNMTLYTQDLEVVVK